MLVLQKSDYRFEYSNYMHYNEYILDQKKFDTMFFADELMNVFQNKVHGSLTPVVKTL